MVSINAFFNDFITPGAFQTQNFGKVSGCIGALLHPYDILYFTDTILFLVLVAFLTWAMTCSMTQVITTAEDDELNYCLEDKPFFKELMSYLESLPQPLYAKMITLSNHFPYPLDE